MSNSGHVAHAGDRQPQNHDKGHQRGGSAVRRRPLRCARLCRRPAGRNPPEAVRTWCAPAAARHINLLAEIIKRLCLATRHLRRMATELPPPDTKRWTVRRKAAVVQAVRVGMISILGACLRYGLSVEEFLSWQRAVERHGIQGLRVTRLQIYRDTEELRSAKR